MAGYSKYFSSLISQAGSDTQNAALNLDHHTMTVNEMDNYRESVSGVSLDEELSNLIKYQRSYQASSKLISSATEMMDMVIAMIR